MCPFPMELGSGEELRIEFLKIFAEGSYQGSEKMDGIQEHITRDEALVKEEVFLRRCKMPRRSPAE